MRAPAAAICAYAAALAATACADRVAGPPAPSGPSLERVAAAGAPATLLWQQITRDAVVRARTAPNAAARVYALVSLAEFVAVVHADAGGGRRQREAERGAIAGASAAVLAYLYPADAATFESMLRDQGEQGAGWLHPFFERGVAIGRDQAARVITRARADGSDAVWTGTVPVGPGLWVSTTPPAGPLLGQMRPFFLTSGSQFRPDPPPAFGSPEYLAGLAEVRRISDTRTAEQTRIAQYWALPAGTVTTQGWWDHRTAEIITREALDERHAAFVMALVNTAAADALIACFDAKYTYWLIRPTQADPGITLAIALPSHPSYPSAHACLSGASAEVLGALFPGDAAELSAAADEAGLSRVYAGIHYPFDVRVGRALGQTVARYALDFEMQHGLLAVMQ